MLITIAALALVVGAPQETVPLTREASEALDQERLGLASDEIARWLASVAEPTEAGVSWPAEPGRAASGWLRSPTPALYSGSSGVVLFLLEHHDQRSVASSMELARAGADELCAWVAQGDTDGVQHGLYTGLAGVGFTLAEAARRTGSADYRSAAIRALDIVLESAQQTPAGIRWSSSTDVISGTAGIGLWLLEAAESLDRPDAREIAVRAGDELLAQARPAQGGLAWAMDARFPRTMPNLSHGTAGVGLFLARLTEELAERDDPRAARFLAGAVGAGAHLRELSAARPGGGRLVHHSAPGNEDLFYLGWCHGPVGTVRFLHALEGVSGDSTWRTFADQMLAALDGVGLPEARPAGYWDNVGICCGAAGVASFVLRLSVERDDSSPGVRVPALALALTRDILARGTQDGEGLRWSHCEHRKRPERRSTQTGLMQGAAGVGLWLLELRAALAGQPAHIALPDEPL